MKCARIEELFSEKFDGTLPVGLQGDVDRHLLSCASCRDAYARFEHAIGALHALPHRETSRGVRDAVLAAVDTAATERDGGADERFRRGMAITHGLVAARDRRFRVASHVAIALCGAAAAILWLWLSPSVSFGATEPAETRIVERIVEVPKIVERIVEKFVKVPERVEVEVIRVVEVPRGPLIELPDERIASALGELGRNLVIAAEAFRAAQRAAQEMPREEPHIEERWTEPPRPRPAHPTDPMAYLARATVDIVDHHGRITLRMSGPLRELVPVLLAKLDSPNEQIALLVERRLAAIRETATADPELGPRLVEPVANATPRAYGSKAFRGSEPVDSRSASERWGAWWAANGDLLAAAAPRLDL